MSEMLEVTIDSMRVSLTNQQRILVLKESAGERYLPVWIGAYESEAIVIALQEIEVSRPQAHDLMKSLLRSLDGHLQRVEIASIRADTFYAFLVLQKENAASIRVDCRPSDAIALAVRCHVPIFADSEVMDEAGIIEEADIRHESLTSTGTKKPVENDLLADEDATGADLSVFDDFLKKIDLNNNQSGKGKSASKPSDPDDKSHPGDLV